MDTEERGVPGGDVSPIVVISPRSPRGMGGIQVGEEREQWNGAERRSGRDRRSGVDRRKAQDASYQGPERRSGGDRRSGKERRRPGRKPPTGDPVTGE